MQRALRLGAFGSVAAGGLYAAWQAYESADDLGDDSKFFKLKQGVDAASTEIVASFTDTRTVHDAQAHAPIAVEEAAVPRRPRAYTPGMQAPGPAPPPIYARTSGLHTSSEIEHGANLVGFLTNSQPAAGAKGRFVSKEEREVLVE